MSVFPPEAREAFAANYPEACHKLRHRLGDHPLLSLEALAELADFLPANSVESNVGDLPIAVDRPPAQLKDAVSETIRKVDSSNAWVMLKRIEQHPRYQALLEELLGELSDVALPRTGQMMTLEGFVFVSSPGAVTPFHFDPEHNILLQLRGTKTMTQFPQGDPFYVADELHEAYHTGGQAELPWRDEMLPGGTEWHLAPGEGLFVPVMSPHFVRNGPEPSVSLSITWRSEWSYAEADARAFNAWMRRVGRSPRAPGRWPHTNRAKAYAWRAMRRLGVKER